MHRTLLWIPHEIAGWPVFGWGLFFGFLLLVCILQLIWGMRRGTPSRELTSQAIGWIVAMAVVVFIVPKLELTNIHGEPIGVAVRGYGAFLLSAVLAAIALVLFRARRIGISDETVFSLVPWLVGGGIVGARMFYVIQNRDQFFQGSAREIIGSVLSFTSGGMVVYGSLIGGLITGAIFCRLYKHSFFKLGDMIIPALFIGIALGRLGCLMNGCCWGGRCEEQWSAIHFPQGSPVYEDQMLSGDLVGIKLEPGSRTDTGGTVAEVVPGSLADQAGIQPKEVVALKAVPPPLDQWSKDIPSDDYSHYGLSLISNQHHVKWTAEELPSRAMPVMPAQLISAIDALILCGFLLLIADRVKRYHGLLLCLGFALYAVIRFGEEIVRVDEPGRFGTSLSIGQWVSIVSLMFFGSMMIWVIKRTPKGEGSHEP